ncbi:Scr1 family TA system antitoxin-like transcriptional regulator [Nonomuraea ferruginea]|uniref:Scr1 family TA system antitoxin-like transcriptional regulator n=1 Tax=Nonomuraea ferruginea TaxID=46174 RepID=UPI00361FE616
MAGHPRTVRARLSVILDESVLLRHIGGPEVMAEQLRYLLDMMARPYITVRIVPLSARSTAGLIGELLSGLARPTYETIKIIQRVTEAQ